MCRGLRRRRTDLVALLALLLLLRPTAAAAVGLVDPLLQFRQLRTDHFVIYYHTGAERLAARLAAIVESVRTEVGGSLGLTPPSRTHVILADQADLANGWATPFPRNIVMMYAAAPSGSEFIGRTDDWLRLLFVHEYTHVVHLDRSGGWSRIARAVLGRSQLAMPNTFLPQWQIEGLATWQESALTGQGRLFAGDFRAIERTQARVGRFPLDRQNGGLVSWPDGHAPYAYGLGFHEYLVNRFGQQSLGALTDRTTRWLPFTGSRAFRTVYGRSLGSLWRDYVEETRAREAATSEGPAVDRAMPTRLTQHGQIVTAPRFAPPACDSCGAAIVYSLQKPDRFPELRIVAPDGSADRALTTRFLGNTSGMLGDGIVFDQQEVRRNVGVYSDVYVYRRTSGQVLPLTRNERLRDPDVSADGQRLVAVRQRGGERELVVARLDAAATRDGGSAVTGLRVLGSGPEVQFSAPRWSPDGRMIAVERRRVGALPEIVVVTVDTGDTQVVASDARTRFVTPTWRRDGGAIVAAADYDGGPFDLYEFSVDGSMSRRLTRTQGAIWPDVSPDGATLVFAGYTPDGFDVFAVPYSASGSSDSRNVAAARPETSPELAITGARYNPFATLAPTSWEPLLTVDDNETRAGGAVSGWDVLARHRYSAALTWLVRAPASIEDHAQARPDWSVSYAYTRWRPSLFAAASRETSYLRLPIDAADRTVVREQDEYQAGVFVPVGHARHSEQLLASVVVTEPRFKLPGGVRSTRLVSSRFGAATNTARVYGYSVSPEHGVNLGATTELAREALGSSAAATTSTVDARGYLPGAARQHVIALRAASGISKGAAPARQLFQLGGQAVSSSVIDFGGDIGLLRGFSSDTFGGTRIANVTAEYRLPLARIERGAGTFPAFVRWVHAAAFVDAGRVWSDSNDSTWKRSWGGELAVDLVAGYTLPISLVFGAASRHDGAAARGWATYARIGRAF